MHEMSIARALLGNLLSVCPEDSQIESVQVHVGASRALEPELLRSAWTALTQDDPRCAESRLELQLEPWQLHCRDCGREFSAETWDVICHCGGRAQLRQLGQELWIESMDVRPLACSSRGSEP